MRQLYVHVFPELFFFTSNCYKVRKVYVKPFHKTV